MCCCECSCQSTPNRVGIPSPHRFYGEQRGTGHLKQNVLKNLEERILGRTSIRYRKIANNIPVSSLGSQNTYEMLSVINFFFSFSLCQQTSIILYVYVITE